jgi:hypothetical protein
MTYYPERDDDIEKKRELAEAFLEEPSRDAFAELVDHRGFWATEPRRSIDYYVDDIVFDEQTPAEVATAVKMAVENTDALNGVLELDGFGWATATELLHVLVPDTYAIHNKRAVAGMEALGYEVPSTQTASIDEYWEFVTAVEDAIKQYNLRGVVNASSEAPDVPAEATEFEAADSAFNAHYDNDAEDLDLRDVRETQTAGTQLEISDELAKEIDQAVTATPTYRDVEDFLYSAVRRELERAR